MYDSGVRVVVFVWRPFHVCFAHFSNSEGGGILRICTTKLIVDSLQAITELLCDSRGEKVGAVL